MYGIFDPIEDCELEREIKKRNENLNATRPDHPDDPAGL